MAPPPEYDKEPKAPDKSATTVVNEDSNVHTIVNELQTISDQKAANTTSNNEFENNKHVETLDDGQLRALLDEAIQYKCPKDREGKSSLFKELLEEVEHQEESEASRAFTGGRGTHANSLQDLMAALKVESAQRPNRHHHPQHSSTPVSARAIHGGSLPSGVDTSFLVAEEPARGGYLATVRCVNPPPLAERRVSASDANCPAEVELLNKRSKPMFPMYTARATLEIGSGSVCSGRAVTTTTASNQVDSAIPFSCITTPEVVASCNTTSSTSQAAVAVDPKPRSVISSTFNGLPLSRPNYGSTASATSEEYKKSLDENGNAVQGISSPISGSSQHKKPRRKKSSKNETVIKSHQIDGYQGNKDLNEVLRFIESNADSGRNSKLSRSKHKDDSDDKGGKKRSTERRKDKESKMKRATSMEELSRTKLEDLTDAGEPPLRADKERRDPPAKAERRSWGDSFLYHAEPEPEPAPELTDFQTVTKRRKPRRRLDEPEQRRARPPSPRDRPRRESAPPSDRSNDSNDDMDSVHSLPAEATRTALAPAPAPLVSAPPPAAPHASYADIARTRHNIPDLIESCNFYAEGESGTITRRTEPASTPGDADGYPALEARAGTGAGGGGGAPQPARPRPKPGAVVVRRDRKERPAPPPPECPAPDVVADRRPPVILLDSTARPRDMDGVTFGFDINEQLLGGPARRPRCDLVRDAPDSEPTERAEPADRTEPAERVEPTATAVPVHAGCLALRYVPPDPPPDTHHLHQIIDYVGGAWEDVIRCTGKVRYFSE